MNFQKNFFSFLAALLFYSVASAQQFAPALMGYSHKKTSYLTLDNGKEVKGTIKDLDWKKGLIEEVKIKDSNDKKVKIKPEEINFMYLPPSGLAKAAATMDHLTDLDQMRNDDLNNDILDKGYVYMEKSEVRIKKKTRTLMMQLVNAHFSKKIKVYDDPMAKQSMGVGIGGVNVAGGGDKSYFVKKHGEKVAFKVEKKNYDQEFKSLFGDCKEFMKKHGKDPRWSDFETHVFEYTQMCN